MSWDRDLAAAIWTEANKAAHFDWILKAPVADRLRDMLPDIRADDLAADAAVVNRRLRDWISPKLRDGVLGLRHDLKRWIVVDWGGIKRNSAKTLRGYDSRLGQFAPSEVETFVAAQATRGISSWSKILAFALPNEHAIYDARTAVALNCILQGLGYGAVFAMPQSQNHDIRAASLRLKQLRARAGKRGDWFGYAEYIDLLKTIVALDDTAAPDCILDVEMAIFTNAPKIARTFVETR